MAYLIQVSFGAASGFVEDASVNTFHTDGVVDADAIDFSHTYIKGFYDTAHGGASDPLTNFISNSRNGVVTQKLYDLSDPEPRTPVDTFTWSFTPPPTIGSLPEEVAICLSYKTSPPTPGVPLQSQRGRIYIGPLNILAIAGAGVGDTNWSAPVRPSAGLMNTIVTSAIWLRDTPPTDQWMVYGPTHSFIGTVDAGFVDNAFDTQRRRGPDATFRSTF